MGSCRGGAPHPCQPVPATFGGRRPGQGRHGAAGLNGEAGRVVAARRPGAATRYRGAAGATPRYGRVWL
ncbi:hypothetical protein GCM10009634_82550 [Saccharothrix xinjiangensis]